ncbi:hypothetical protein U1Q18_011571 [Sarracenia purpurea var. burkii]
MSATGEVENSAAEQLTEEVPAAELSQPPEKPVDEKKPKTTKEKRPRAQKTASHPPYFQMIKEALLALKEKSGSSPYAIAKSMEEKHKEVLPANFRKILALQLKNFAAKGKLIKIKASYKLSEPVREDKKDTTKAAKAASGKKPKQARSITAKASAPKEKATKRRSETEKKVAKKLGPKKTRKSAPAKSKQPKSIKSPAATKTKKATT